MVGSGAVPVHGAPPSGPYAGTAPTCAECAPPTGPPGSPPIGPDASPASGPEGNPPIGPEGIPGIGPPLAGVDPGRPIGPPYAGRLALVPGSALPQLRQYFIPGGFSPWHVPQTEMAGNPCADPGVCAKACAPDKPESELPQFRQNDDPIGLSWPHFEQRIIPIIPLSLNPVQVSQQPQVSGMGAGRFATP
jgi:hypothetical protein